MKLYVGRLPYQTTDQDLADIFGQLGQVLSATVIIDRDSGRSKGFGFVEMSSGAEDAIRALNGAQFQGRTLTVNEAEPLEARPAGADGGRGHDGGRCY